MKTKLHIVLILTLSLVWLILPQAQALGATYYVDGNSTNASDSNPGTSGLPWKTIGKAASSLQPGDTALVREGIYREGVDIRINGTLENPITIKAYPEEKVILEGTKVLTGWTHCTSSSDFPDNQHWQNIFYMYIDATEVPDIENLILFEDGNYLQKAQDPNQSDPVIENVLEFRSLEPESFGETEFLIDSDFLTQPDDYWNGSWVRVWSHAANNVIIQRLIADYIQNEHKIVFDQPLPHPISEGTYPDAYSIVNHPSILDKPGEYYHTTTPDGNNKYKIFLWPRNSVDLENNIQMPGLNRAFYINSGYGSYLTIEGFEIKFYSGLGTRSGGIICPYGFYHTNLIVRNNNVHDIYGYGGISLISGDGDLIEGNIVRNIKGGHGIIATYKNVKVINNFVENTKSTCIYFSGVQNGLMLYNTVGKGGNHANALTTYQGCNNVLVACNRVFAAARPFTMQSSSNITLYNNLFIGDGGYLIADWGGMSGTVTILNNTVIGSSNNASLYVHSADKIVIKNNIVDGGGNAAGVERSHNIYTGLSWSQTPSQGWYPVEGEIIADGSGEYDIYDIFVDPDNHDYRLKENSIAIDAGIDITEYLPTDVFPDYDFGVDIGGNPRPYGLGWDIGPYEYTLLPRVVISAQPKQGYLPLKVLFGISELITPNGEIETWKWDFGDGTTSQEKEPSHTYTSPGEYTATLIVTDIEKYQGRAQTHITVLEKEKEFEKLMMGCYNNVFNPTKGEKALIWVELQKRARVKISLYNTRGNKIRELADKEEDAGPHKYHWDGTNDSGSVVGSGLYFVHIEAGDYKKTKKIVVVK